MVYRKICRRRNPLLEQIKISTCLQQVVSFCNNPRLVNYKLSPFILIRIEKNYKQSMDTFV